LGEATACFLAWGASSLAADSSSGFFLGRPRPGVGVAEGVASACPFTDVLARFVAGFPASGDSERFLKMVGTFYKHLQELP
jgi:hypothetical protein